MKQVTAGAARPRRSTGPLAAALLAAALGLWSAGEAAAAPSGAVTVTLSPAGLGWQPAIDYRAAALIVAGPDGIVARRQLGAGEPLLFAPVDGAGQPLADGWYRWELRLTRAPAPAAAEALQQAERAGDEAAVRRLARAAGAAAHRSSGRFRVEAGSIRALERLPAAAGAAGTGSAESPAGAAAAPGSLAPTADSVIENADPRLTFVDDTPENDFYLEADADLLGVYDADAPDRRVVAIEAGAAADSIYVAPDSVGLFTTVPGAGVELHVAALDDVPELRLEDTGMVGASQAWDLQVLIDAFQIQDATALFPPTGGVVEIERTSSFTAGNPTYELTFRGDTTIENALTVEGDVALGSSRELKTAFEPVSGTELLVALERLELATWSYKSDPAAARHLGPVAEEFHRLFGLGRDDKHISPADTAGLALAVARELAARLADRDGRIAALEERLAALEQALAEAHEPAAEEDGSGRR